MTRLHKALLALSLLLLLPLLAWLSYQWAWRGCEVWWGTAVECGEGAR